MGKKIGTFDNQLNFLFGKAPEEKFQYFVYLMAYSAKVNLNIHSFEQLIPGITTANLEIFEIGVKSFLNIKSDFRQPQNIRK